jgi:hypothetical protein
MSHWLFNKEKELLELFYHPSKRTHIHFFADGFSWDSLKALWIILVLAALAFGIIAVSYPDSIQAFASVPPLNFTCAQAVNNQSGNLCVT